MGPEHPDTTVGPIFLGICLLFVTVLKAADLDVETVVIVFIVALFVIYVFVFVLVLGTYR